MMKKIFLLLFSILILISIASFVSQKSSANVTYFVPSCPGTCTTGSWVSCGNCVTDQQHGTTSCTLTCTGGQVCTPGAKSCAGSSVVLTCNSAGTGWTETSCNSNQTCSGGACVAKKICTPGAKQCNGTNGGSVQTCNSAGTAWTTTETCTNNYCFAGACTCASPEKCVATSGCIVGYGNENGQCSNDAICCEPNGIITTPCATPCNVCVVNGDVECTPDFDGAKIVQGACNIGSTCCGGMPTTEFAAGVVLCSKSTNKYWNISSYIPGSVLGPGCKNLSGGTVMLTTGTTTGCPSGTKAYRVVNYYNATLNDDACNFGSDIASGCVAGITVAWNNGYSSGVTSATAINTSNYDQNPPLNNSYLIPIDVSYSTCAPGNFTANVVSNTTANCSTPATTTETFTWSATNTTSFGLWYCDMTLAANHKDKNGNPAPVSCTRGSQATTDGTQAGWYWEATKTTSPVGPTNAPNAAHPFIQGHVYSWEVEANNGTCHTDSDGGTPTTTFTFAPCNTNGSVSGQVYIDNTGTGNLAGDANYTTTPLEVTLTDQTGKTVATTLTSGGTYTITNVAPGTYNAALTAPNRYNITSPAHYPPTVIVTSATNTAQDFGIEPPATTFNASGEVYVDTDKNGQRCVNGENPDQTTCSGTEPGYTGTATITICQIDSFGSCNPYETLTANTADGTFTTANTTPLTTGEYTATLTVPPPYESTSPRIANFTVGASCRAPAYAGCDTNGNVINLDFGVSNSIPWIQVSCADLMFGEGFSENIPSTASLSCSGGSYAATTSDPTCTAAGVIYAGSQTPSFAPGQASALDWVVGGIEYPYTYNLPLSNEANSSYVNLSYIVGQSNVPTKSLSDYCGSGGLADCTLPASLANFPSGVYTVGDSNNVADLKLDSPDGSGTYAFPGGGNYVILVNGIFTINTKIFVPNTSGSFVLFSSSDDTNVTPTVGEATPTTCDPTTHAGCDLEGYYSTDENFNLQGDANCSQNSADLQLNIAGSVVVNAVTTNGGALNYDSRDLCSDNLTCPVLTITERPNLLLNAPAFLLFPRRVWQEVAP